MSRDAVLQWVGAVCTSAALLSGCGGGADGAAVMAAPDDGSSRALQAVGTITLGNPRVAFSQSDGSIGLDWSTTDLAATTYSLWVSPREGQPFVEVAGKVTGNSAVFHPGPSWRLDFPSAQVRVRGCDASCDNCTDSNAQRLGAVLVEARPSLIPSVDPFQSKVGGSSVYAIDDAGSVIAALRRTALGMLNTSPEGWDPARVDVYGPGLVTGTPPVGLPTTDFRAPTGSMALSGDGNTLAVNQNTDVGGDFSAPGVPGRVVVYAAQPAGVSGVRAWRQQAVIEAPPSLGVFEHLGVGMGMALSDDGRRLAVTASTCPFCGGGESSVLVFDRQDDGRWEFAARILSATSNRLAMSGNGLVIAFGAPAGMAPFPGGGLRPFFEVRVHESDNGGWPLRATLRSDEFPYADADAAAVDDFGEAGLAVSDDGRTIAVGAPRIFSTTRPGGIYVFGDRGGQWQRRALLVNAGEPASDLFGRELTLSGNGRVLAGSACGRIAPASGVNRNYASSMPPVEDQPCNPWTRQTGVSHGAQVFQRDDAGAWSLVASVVPTLPPPHILEGERVQQNWLLPRLSHDGGTLAIGSYRQFDPSDGLAGEASLLIY